MCARAKDPQEEKNQQKIEVILEEKQRAILTQSYSLINLVLVLLGVYVAVLSVIFFPYFFSSRSTNTLILENNTSIQQVSTVSTTVYSIVASFALILSILLIILSITDIWRSIALGNAGFKDKFIEKKCPFASVQLKSGNKLRNRNLDLFKYVIEQNKSNDHSIYFLILSLILFIIFILANIDTEASLKAFYCLFILLIFALVILMVYYRKNFGK